MTKVYLKKVVELDEEFDHCYFCYFYDETCDNIIDIDCDDIYYREATEEEIRRYVR